MAHDVKYEELVAILLAYFKAGQSRIEEYKNFLRANMQIDLPDSANEEIETAILTILVKNIARELVADIDINHPVSPEEINEMVDVLIAKIPVDPDDPDVLSDEKKKAILAELFKNVYEEIRTAAAGGVHSSEDFWKIVNTIRELASQNGSAPDNPRFIGFVYDEIIRRTESKDVFLTRTFEAMAGLFDADKMIKTILKPLLDALEEDMREEGHAKGIPEALIQAVVALKRDEVTEKLKETLTVMFAQANNLTHQWAEKEAARIFG